MRSEEFQNFMERQWKISDEEIVKYLRAYLTKDQRKWLAEKAQAGLDLGVIEARSVYLHPYLGSNRCYACFLGAVWVGAIGTIDQAVQEYRQKPLMQINTTTIPQDIPYEVVELLEKLHIAGSSRKSEQEKWGIVDIIALLNADENTLPMGGESAID